MVMRMRKVVRMLLVVFMNVMMMVVNAANSHDYGEALTKSLLFFEGQRSGKLPPSQRITWRMDSALLDGSDLHVDLVGGYYDAGDNVKFHFPMAYTTTMLAWGVLEFGEFMSSDLQHAHEAIRWATDYFLKATSVPGVVYAQVGDPYGDHNCWERPEDMDTPRTTYAVTENKPGSEVSAEIAAALAASSMVFYGFDRRYSKLLLRRASRDELIWAAAWLHKATKATYYWNYVTRNIHSLDSVFAEFGWDAKHAGINILLSKFVLDSSLFRTNADKFVCSVLPESPTKSVTYSPVAHGYDHSGDRRLTQCNSGEKEDTVAEETCYDRQLEAEETLCEVKLCHASAVGERVAMMGELAPYPKNFVDPLRSAEEVLSPGFNKSLSGPKDDFGPGISLEVDPAQPYGPNVTAGPSSLGTLGLKDQNLGRSSSFTLNPFRKVKKSGKKKAHVEGFSRFATLYGQKAATTIKHSSKFVILKSAVAALAQLDLSKGKSSSSSFLLKEAKATIKLGEQLGINFKSKKVAVMDKIIDLELNDKVRIKEVGSANL
ncbi:hypothetical protein TEA_010494 [Camellia sinensis var. sinensis]|uniref:cellulase n=1 Tax=Camellia sinensis var. sinensis TaxID=542762 RepID=A0A4S4EK58_CAMSN|nr:hypothetical protein TEA_010494 [Camellia sinensis var. sinensis]